MFPKFAVVGGKKLAYYDYPSAAPGEVALFIHGAGSTADSWHDIPMRLAGRGVRAIAVDIMGHGLSSTSPGDYSLAAHADALANFLQGQGVEKVHLVGHSLGGGIALQMSIEYPALVSSVTLVSSGGLGKDTAKILRAACLPGASALVRVVASRAALGVFRKAASVLAARHLAPYELSDGVLDLIARLGDGGHRTAFIATLSSVVSPRGQRLCALDHLDMLAGLPVTLVTCEKDPVIPPAHAIRAHSLLPGSDLYVFAGSSHEPHNREPDLFASLVFDKIATCTPVRV